MSQFKSFWVKKPLIIEKCEGKPIFFMYVNFKKKLLKKKTKHLFCIVAHYSSARHNFCTNLKEIDPKKGKNRVVFFKC